LETALSKEKTYINRQTRAIMRKVPSPARRETSIAGPPDYFQSKPEDWFAPAYRNRAFYRPEVPPFSCATLATRFYFRRPFFPTAKTARPFWLWPVESKHGALWVFKFRALNEEGAPCFKPDGS